MTAEPLIHFDIEQSLGAYGLPVTTIKCHGRLMSESAKEIRELVKPLIEAGRRRIVIDCSDLQFVDSSGLGALVSGYTTLTGQQGQLKLLNLTKKVHDLLQITKLLTVFEVYDNENTALKSFR